MILPDLVPAGLRVVFCGTAAGTASAMAGAYYAGPGNRFWSILYETGLTPRRLAPGEFGLLPEWGIGLTDVCKTAHGMDREIATNAFDPARLRKVLDEVRPHAVAFNGKRAARLAFGSATARRSIMARRRTLSATHQLGCFPRPRARTRAIGTPHRGMPSRLRLPRCPDARGSAAERALSRE